MASRQKLQEMWALCLDVAQNIYIKRPPTEAYALRVARLLFGTGVHESGGFAHTRQKRFEFDSLNGAHGYWQVEFPTLKHYLAVLRNNGELRLQCMRWYLGTQAPGKAELLLTLTPPSVVAWEVCGNPRLACMLARIHYLLDKDPVPDTVAEQATYWGRVYNTRQEMKKNAQWAHAYEQAASMLNDPALVNAQGEVLFTKAGPTTA